MAIVTVVSTYNFRGVMTMLKRNMWVAGAAILFVALLAGCGGGGGPEAPATSETGTVGGSVDLAGNPADDYAVLVDGIPTEAEIDPGGSFEVSGVPEGEHAIDVVRNDGLESGRATVVVAAGQRAQISDQILLWPAGQICGIVVKIENGIVEPLAGVQVVARSDLVWIQTEDGVRLGPAEGPDDAPLVYPPPPGVTYSAFTNESGSYCMKGVRPGPYLVVVAVPGLTLGRAYVFVRPYHTAVADFQLRPVTPPPVGTVMGTVRGAGPNGAVHPLVGALVTIFCNNWQPVPPIDPAPVIGAGAGELPPGTDTVVPPEIVWKAFRTLTNREGRYWLTVPSGPAVMAVWKRFYAPQKREMQVPNGGTIIENFLLRLLDNITLPPAPDAK